MTWKIFILLLFMPTIIFSNIAFWVDKTGRILAIDFEKYGTAEYIYDNDRLIQIIRKSEENEILYKHTYHYNEDRELLSEDLIGDLGQITYSVDPNTKTYRMTSPYHLEVCEYNDKNQLITHTQDELADEYQYNESNELILDTEPSDIICEYDANQNLIKTISPAQTTEFKYDEQNKLIQVTSDNLHVEYTYYENGTRMSKTIHRNNGSTTEYYVNFNNNPIAIYNREGELQQLRIPGCTQHSNLLCPIAIETCDTIYAPIHNIQKNISKLIDIYTKQVHTFTIDPYGQNLGQQEEITPWIFSNKHYDPETNLVYFGARYYNPSLRQWISPDAIENPLRKTPYQYCLSNPFFYFDPDGNFDVTILSLSWGAGMAITSPIWGPYALTAISAVAIGYYAPKIIDSANQWMDNRTIAKRRRNASVYDNARNLYDKYAYDYIPVDKLTPMSWKKEGGVDPTLPKDPLNNPNLEDISNPKAKAKGHHTLKDKKTGEIIRYDKGKPWLQGHKGHDHYHRMNPNATGKHNQYLDTNGNPVSAKSKNSHLYRPENAWWK